MRFFGRRRLLDNRDFWNRRYRTDPALGSGVGSRGEVAAYKRNLVETEWRSIGGGSVLDIGFGDLEMLDISVFDRYLGVDISDVAIERAQRRYPQHQFVHADFGGRREPDVPAADLVLCFDVLIHQFDPEAYQRIVERIVRRTRRVGIVAGYNREPQNPGPITTFHEPVRRTLRRCGAREISRIGSYRGIAVMRFEGPAGPTVATDPAA
ncbi:MAG TPA: class I SAM-dependent methyltransferase [Mycobacteriales bacterium]|nr:class I SAM-dependent methyltransferase [Mycobacteriales bacterium]